MLIYFRYNPLFYIWFTNIFFQFYRWSLCWLFLLLCGSFFNFSVFPLFGFLCFIPPKAWVIPLSCISTPYRLPAHQALGNHLGYEIVVAVSQCLCSVTLVLLLIVSPKRKSSDAGNSDMPERSQKVLSLSKRWVPYNKILWKRERERERERPRERAHSHNFH